MKKNKMMRLASILLVLVLMTSSVVGGTFAKYITSASGTDTARVAKWGVDVVVTVDGAFATEYAATTQNLEDVTGAKIEKTVISSGTDNILAPGTNGTLLAKASITGAPEVSTKVTKVATLDLGENWVVDGVYYCPLTINGVYGMYYASADAFEEAVEATLNEEFYAAANADLTADKTVEWSWAFEGTDGQQTDDRDTALGDAAADGKEIKINFTYAITVEQVD